MTIMVIDGQGGKMGKGLVEMLKKTDYDLRELDGIEVSAASLSDDRADIHNPIPMGYQSGYLTIKKFDEHARISE